MDSKLSQNDVLNFLDQIPAGLIPEENVADFGNRFREPVSQQAKLLKLIKVKQLFRDNLPTRGVVDCKGNPPFSHVRTLGLRKRADSLSRSISRKRGPESLGGRDPAVAVG